MMQRVSSHQYSQCLDSCDVTKNMIVSLTLPPGKFFILFCRLLIFFKITYLKKIFMNTIKVSNSLDPDQARHFVRPDLGPNCLQRLSADDTSRLRVNASSQNSFLGGRYLTFILT